ncbi:MAG TPA: class I SAM-dependent methyltransferase [Streptosporangiaceae bacterium]
MTDGPERPRESPSVPRAQPEAVPAARLATLTAKNRRHWDDVFDRFAGDPQFAIHDVVAGMSSIPAEELREIGDVKGRRGLHLQCGLGLDTISLARRGAQMTGVDISAKACVSAASIAERCGLDIPFIQADVLDRDQLPDRQYDFVYTSHGVLRWLPDLDRWASNIHYLLKPGGWIYMFEIHPIVYRLQAVEGERFTLVGDYFDESTHVKVARSIHLGSVERLDNREVAHTNWTISTILGSLLRAGLCIASFQEHAASSYSRKGLLSVRSDGLWHSRSAPPVPLGFSMRAVRYESVDERADER